MQEGNTGGISCQHLFSTQTTQKQAPDISFQNA
jgi:hypothetical protein